MRFPFAFFQVRFVVPFWRFMCVFGDLAYRPNILPRPWMIRAGLESQRVDKFYYGGVSRWSGAAQRRRRVLTCHFYIIAL